MLLLILSTAAIQVVGQFAVEKASRRHVAR